MSIVELELTLKDFFLSADFPISEVGLFVGAGSSCEAGYPLTWQLTKDVYKQLDEHEIKLLQEILSSEALTIDIEKGYPDIETTNDYIMKSCLEAPSAKKKQLQEKIKNRILTVFKDIKNIDLKHHRELVKFLKNRSFGKASDFWIFSTNYDLLFEEACSHEECSLENGFVGSTHRYFNVSSIRSIKGVKKATFFPHQECVFRLYKLHGSMSWYSVDDKIFESFKHDNDNAVILPNRKKVFSAMYPPYKDLFSSASEVIGDKCKFLICIGHSFRDDHINDLLILPKLKEGRLKVLVLISELNASLEKFKEYPSFQYITSSEAKLGNKVYSVNSDLWKFSSFVKFLQKF